MICIVEVLKEARELIDDRDYWTKGTRARTPDGKQCLPTDPHAASWDVAGAVRYVCRKKGCESFGPTGTLLLSSKEVPLTYFNDHNSHEEVMALFYRAINIAEEALAR